MRDNPRCRSRPHHGVQMASTRRSKPEVTRLALRATAQMAVCLRRQVVPEWQYESMQESSNEEMQSNDPTTLESVLEVNAVVPHPWHARVSAFPTLPNGTSGQLASLRKALQFLQEAEGDPTAMVQFEGVAPRPLSAVANHLAPAGLIKRSEGKLFLTEAASEWLRTEDPFVLIAVLHKHIRFVGELMHYLLPGPRTMRELQQHAATKYLLDWSSLDQARRRTNWLQQLGYLEMFTATTYGLTPKGEEVSSLLIAGEPPKQPDVAEAPSELPKIPTLIAAELKGLSSSELGDRASTIGYIPKLKGNSGITESIEKMVNASSPSISREDYAKFAETEFAIKRSSFESVLSMLTKARLVEASGVFRYSPTELGAEWLEDPTALNLVYVLHLRFKFVLEIIPALKESGKTSSLAKIGKSRYGMGREDASGVRTRLHLLKQAGLIREKASWQYEATPLGEAIAIASPIENPLGEPPGPVSSSLKANEHSQRPSADVNPFDLTARELVKNGTASDSPDRLEHSIAKAFTLLGFAAEHRGGAGKTDVYATVQDQFGNETRIIIDGKAAQSGNVSESAVHFDTLQDHKSREKADRVVLIGPGFEMGRIKQRAQQNKVTLVTTQELADILLAHKTHPLLPWLYLGFIDADSSKRQKFHYEASRNQQQIDLLARVLEVLAKERDLEDDVTHGALEAKQIYLIVRQELDHPVTGGDIQSALDLLQHPLIGAVQQTAKNNQTFRLTINSNLAAHRINALASAISRLATPEEVAEVYPRL